VQFVETVDPTILWRALSALVLGWLAYFFGRTLRTGCVPLIERIARVRDPELPPALCRYTRRLTAVWTLYFVAAGLLSFGMQLPFLWAGGLIWLGAISLFVGEHRLRPYLFPGRSFPNLIEQVQDTARIWRGAS
jgi:uncharacterized membrane protein